MIDITKSPCPRDCSSRNAECHGKCKKYLDWAAARETFRNKKMNERQMISFLDAQTKHRTKKLSERGLQYGRHKK